MDPLQITTGEKRIPIVRDGESVGTVAFNPSDVVFAEKFYLLIGNLQSTLTQYRGKSLELDSETALDANQMPVNMAARLELVKEACLYVRGEIDTLFGVGTSQMVFGDLLSLDTIKQFLDGLTPHIQAARAEKVAKYTSAPGRMRKRK